MTEKTPGEVAWFACWKAQGLSPNQQEWEQERHHNQSTFADIEAAVRAEFEPPLLERIAVQDQRIAELEKAWAVDELALELQGVLPCNEAQVFRDRIAELEAKLTPCKQCSTIAGQPMCHGGNQCNPLAATDVFG